MDTSGHPSHLPDSLLEGSKEMTRKRPHLQHGSTKTSASRGRGILFKPHRVRANGYLIQNQNGSAGIPCDPKTGQQKRYVDGTDYTSTSRKQKHETIETLEATTTNRSSTTEGDSSLQGGTWNEPPPCRTPTGHGTKSRWRSNQNFMHHEIRSRSSMSK